MIANLAVGGLVFLLLGGVAYTVGAVLYLIGRHKKYVHCIWHFFVLAGSIMHYFSILFYVVLAKPVV
jgi:hemolysin III